MLNPFALFDLPIAFEIDETLLKARYLARQKQYHPDNFVQCSQEEQREAMQKSTQINDAWQILAHPVSRAECIIALAQNAESTSYPTHHDVEFLMQQMAWREELEKIESTRDLSALDDLLTEVNKAYQTTYQTLQQYLTQKDWQQAQQQIQHLQFIQKMISEIDRVDEILTCC